jgi:hypothetical protein|tara:strand:+ start:428 stop:640 length:213 start_codon:yes stop_codon:yes gene_type:complete
MSISNQIRNQENRLYEIELSMDTVFSTSRKEYQKLDKKRKNVRKKLDKLIRRRDSQEPVEAREFLAGDIE